VAIPVSEECLFCAIAAGDAPADVVARNDHAIAFRDINPQAPTHVLVIPVRHITSAADMGPDDADVLAPLFALAAEVAMKEKLDDGWRLVTNVGRGAGQAVFHLHFHLLGGRSLAWPPG
jgi:histidine triad (HIT) family protein